MAEALRRPPTVRRAARALVIDDSKRLLLFRGELPELVHWWFAPGGALEPHETHEAALVRELREETGLAIDVATLSGAVWTRDHLFNWKGKVERHLERFFLVPISHYDVDTSNFETTEVGVIRDHRWWRLEEIQTSRELFAPRRLAEHIAPLLGGTIPQQPVEVGE
jgi:8-oxo-dGTP pyrophosphatase MutT (NUDIX family)